MTFKQIITFEVLLGSVILRSVIPESPNSKTAIYRYTVSKITKSNGMDVFDRSESSLQVSFYFYFPKIHILRTSLVRTSLVNASFALCICFA